MKKSILIAILLLLQTLPLHSEDKMPAEEVYNAGTTMIKKTIKRATLESEGWDLAKQGLFEQALIKYRAATDPSLINHKGDESVALCAICRIYVRQGKLDDALELHEKHILPLNPEKDSYIDTDLEIRALIKARDTKNNGPIYEHIAYIKDKYKKYIPPNGYALPYDTEIDGLIHLYDYMRDYSGGAAFIDELIRYHSQHKNPNHRLAFSEHVKEYQRVKKAWELDEKTGKHGHLQEVIKTSDVISW
jgi:hypothetical protein